jgi:hypothetical protein
VVTDYGLAHWLLQTYKFDINEMSMLKPSHMPSSVFDEIKSLCKDQINWKDKQTTKSEHLIVQKLLNLIQKEQ